jgi:Xaa-Pro aminopeptidase
MNHTSLYQQRRAALAAQLGKNGIAIVPTAPEQQRNRDADFLFRHDSYFYYLSGFTEPRAWLVLTGDGTTTLFCQPKDLEREIWDGFRLGPDAAPAALGVNAAYSVDELDTRLPKMLENRDVVWYPFATHKGLESRVAGWLEPVRSRVRYGALCPEQQRDLCGPLDEMRLVKDPHEQATMRRAAQISAGAHIRAMQKCADMLRAGEEVREYHLDAELLHEFRQHGSQYPAYGSIVGQTSERKDALTGDTIVNRPARVLRAGMVLTIEPGIYVRPGPGVPEQFHNIGIRIEDDAIVTDAGCELISRGVPVDADAIEALMRG